MRSIFNPSNRPISGQNPQSGGSSTKPSKQTILGIFGRFPLFYNAGLGDEIQPVVDTSLYYPLKPLFKEQIVPSGNDIFWNPEKGKHWMVYFLDVQTGGGGYTYSIFTQLYLINQVALTIFEWDTISTYFGEIPIVGGKIYVNEAAPGVGTYGIEGVKSIYLNSDMQIVVHNLALPFPPGNTTNSRIVYLELPESQPFGGGALTL